SSGCARSCASPADHRPLIENTVPPRNVASGVDRAMCHSSLVRSDVLRGGTMRYILLICEDEAAAQAASPAEGEAMMAGYAKFGEEMGKRGVLQTGERLRPTTDATTVQVRN